MLGIVWALSVCIAPIHITAFDPPPGKYADATALLAEIAVQRAEIEALRDEVHGLWITLADHIADVESDGDDGPGPPRERLVKRKDSCKSGLMLDRLGNISR